VGHPAGGGRQRLVETVVSARVVAVLVGVLGVCAPGIAVTVVLSSRCAATPCPRGGGTTPDAAAHRGRLVAGREGVRAWPRVPLSAR